jgi:hypothetical protein
MERWELCLPHGCGIWWIIDATAKEESNEGIYHLLVMLEKRSLLAPKTWSVPSVLLSTFGTNKRTIPALVLMNLNECVQLLIERRKLSARIRHFSSGGTM